jgi:hypothetical protein
MSKRLKVKESSFSIDGVEEVGTSKNFNPLNIRVDSVKVESSSTESTKKLKLNRCMIDNSDSNNETQTIDVELQQFNLYNNKYRLIEEIANGAFATVFKVEEISTKKMLL